MESVESLEGLTLSFQDYKERDGILRLLTPEGVVSVFCRGVQSLKSKNRRLCTPFLLVRLEVFPGRNAYSLKRGTLLESFLDVHNLLYQVTLQLLNDLILKGSGDPWLYQGVLYLWQSEARGNWMRWACYVLARILILEGLAPYLEGCVVCNSKKKIAAIDRSQGGFVCQAHLAGQQPWTRDRLAWFRALFHRNPEQFKDLAAPDQEACQRDFQYLLNWYEYQSHYSGKSIAFWREVYHMELAAQVR